MTDPKGTRRRRRTDANRIPADLAEWFAGEPRPPGKSSVPWSALIYPEHLLLADRWAIWKEAHPGSKPPAGFEWLDNPPELSGHARALQDAARRKAGLPLD